VRRTYHPMQYRLNTKIILPAVALAAAAWPFAASAQKRHKPAPSREMVAHVKQENQFVTVDEFVKGRRAPRTPVSVEGYAVMAGRSADGSVRVVVVDSVDHVLSVKDADAFGRGGAEGVVPGSAVARHPSWAWTGKGMQRFAMYAATGTGHAQRQLHDTVAKVRLTGFATGRVISPVTKVEFEDENGNW